MTFRDLDDVSLSYKSYVEFFLAVASVVVDKPAESAADPWRVAWHERNSNPCIAAREKWDNALVHVKC